MPNPKPETKDTMDNEGTSQLENTLDRIISSASDLRRKIEALREENYDVDCDYLDQVKDIHRIKELQRQNQELRNALEDHQHGMEFIMSRYRSQIVELIKLNRVEKLASPIGSTCTVKKESPNGEVPK